ncbi:hypothetical protein Csa_003838, partial [Cucumis sativus]
MGQIKHLIFYLFLMSYFVNYDFEFKGIPKIPFKVALSSFFLLICFMQQTVLKLIFSDIA